jgi:hypothetical protein
MIPQNIVNSNGNGNNHISEGIMPVKKCHKFGRKYYCYNRENTTVSVFTEQIYSLNEIPDFVIAKLIDGKEDVHIAVNEKNNPLSDEEVDQLIMAINETKEAKLV